MAALVVPGAGQLRLIWSLGGSLYAINVMGIVNAGGIAITQALTNTIGTAIKSGFTSSTLKNQICTTVSLVNIGIRDIRSANSAEFLDSGAVVPGIAAGELLPPQTALCITLRTAFAGKSFRGRCYLPGFTELTNGVNGVCSDATPAVAFVTAVKSSLVSSSLDLGVIHRPTAAPLPITAGFITPVTSIVARDLVWDTQRRRAVPGV